MHKGSAQWRMDMNTTNIFVELVVIGLHTLIWVGLLVLSLVGYQNLDLEKVFTVNLALPILAVTYILGILVDRVSDMALGAQDDRLRSHFDFEGLPSFLSMRFYILNKSSDVYEHLEYARSRLRIARASILNFAFTTVASALFLWFQIGQALTTEQRVLACIAAIIIGALLTWISYQAWETLAKTHTNNTIKAYQVLKEEADQDKADAAKTFIV
jgi:hypothetical protein